jgi:hypothetical protein
MSHAAKLFHTALALHTRTFASLGALPRMAARMKKGVSGRAVVPSLAPDIARISTATYSWRSVAPSSRLSDCASVSASLRWTSAVSVVSMWRSGSGCSALRRCESFCCAARWRRNRHTFSHAAVAAAASRVRCAIVRQPRGRAASRVYNPPAMLRETYGHPTRRLAEACERCYGERLASLAVFGSVARGTMRLGWCSKPRATSSSDG